MANKARPLRDDETFVMDALGRHFSAQWQASPIDPPDAYIQLGGRTVAVEVAQLTQHVVVDQENVTRHSIDTPVIKLVKRVEAALQAEIPQGTFVSLVLRPPVKKFREFKRDLESAVRERLADGDQETKFELHGAVVELSVRKAYRPPDRARLVGVVANHKSNSDILANARQTLGLRLAEKVVQCKGLTRPVWLALFNDYFLSDAETYRQALKGLAVSHDFERILVIDGGGRVEDISAQEVAAQR